VERALTVAIQIDIPTATLLKETARKDAQKVVKLVEAIQGLAVKKMVSS